MPDLSFFSKKYLLIKVAASNEDVFQQLISKYYQQLGTHIFNFTNSADLYEDIVQDVFLKIGISRGYPALRFLMRNRLICSRPSWMRQMISAPARTKSMFL